MSKDKLNGRTRVPDDLYLRVIRKAKQKGISINSVAVMAMWKGIDDV